MPVFDGAPPSRHQGSRLVNRTSNIIRSVSTMRDGVQANVSRIRREDIMFAPSDPARGEPCTAATMTSTHVTRIYRSGHVLLVDVALWLGVDSMMSAQISVPDLGAASPVASSVEGGGEQDVRLTLDLPPEWQLGDDYRVYVQAMRVSGADATTVRVLRAWQR